jgi:hypothetical protein
MDIPAHIIIFNGGMDSETTFGDDVIIGNRNPVK